MVRTEQQKADDVHQRVRTTVDQLAAWGNTPTDDRARGSLNISPLQLHQFPSELHDQAGRVLAWARSDAGALEAMDDREFVEQLLDLYERIVLLRGTVDD